MNYKGSYRKLVENAQSALLAAIEIYNKPLFKYREECFVILLLNAWELLLKATLSKNNKSIFYPKKKKEPYKTLSLDDALCQCEKFFPKTVSYSPARWNIVLLSLYRDNSVHFYNEDSFRHVVYSLAQTSIINFRDLLEEIFDIQLEDRMNWTLLPLGIAPPIDVVEFMSEAVKEGFKGSKAVQQYIASVGEAIDAIDKSKEDGNRLITIYRVRLESIKKLSSANAVIGITSGENSGGPLTIYRPQDPNVTHPLRQMDIVKEIESLHSEKFTTYTFQAIVWKHDLKSNRLYCWAAKEGVLTRYSRDLIPFIKKLTRADLGAALKDYRVHMSRKSR